MNITPKVVISQEMIDEANKLVDDVRVHRTQASDIDTLTGILGEFAFAQYFYGDWKRNRVGENRGEADFKDMEIKTSAYPYHENLNLLVREDYAKKRKPPYYVQIIISIQETNSDIVDGTPAFVCGYATSAEVDSALLKDFGSKYKDRKGGYRCHYISIAKLHPMSDLKVK